MFIILYVISHLSQFHYMFIYLKLLQLNTVNDDN